MQRLDRIFPGRSPRRKPGGSDHRPETDDPGERKGPGPQCDFLHVHEHVERRDGSRHGPDQSAREKQSPDQAERGTDRAEHDRFRQKQRLDFISRHT